MHEYVSKIGRMDVDTNVCGDPAYSTGDAYLSIVSQMGVLSAYDTLYFKENLNIERPYTAQAMPASKRFYHLTHYANITDDGLNSIPEFAVGDKIGYNGEHNLNYCHNFDIKIPKFFCFVISWWQDFIQLNQKNIY